MMSKKNNRLNSPRTLQSKLNWILLSLALPANLFILFLVLSNLVRMDQLLLENEKRNLSELQTVVSSDLTVLKNEHYQLMRENYIGMNQLARGQTDAMEITEMWEHIREIRKKTNLIAVGYFITDDSVLPRLTFDREKISPYLIPKLQENLAEIASDQYPPFSLRLFTADSRDYLRWNFHIGRMSYGYLIPIEYLLDTVPGDRFDYTLAPGEILIRQGGIFLLPYKISMPLGNGEVLLTEMIGWPLKNILECAGLVVILMLTISMIPLQRKMIRREVLLPLRRLSDGMAQIEQGNLDFRLNHIARTTDFAYTEKAFNHMASQIQDLKIFAYEKEVEELRVKAMNLALQVNPHFLLNSLNMVYSLIISDRKQLALEYMKYLMRYFRYALRLDDSLVPLSEEMQFTETFLKLQSIRFPNALDSECIFDEAVGRYAIPPLLIENFVENSVKYGRGNGKVMKITVQIQQKDQHLEITIADDGCGMHPETLTTIQRGECPEDEFGKHIGIWNSRKRLRLYYGEDADFRIESTPGEGTTIWLVIPAREVQKNDDPVG